MQVTDWATLLDRRSKPADWDMFVTSGGFVPDPALLTIFSSTYPGWWDTPDKNELFAQFNAEPDQGKRVQMWAKLQAMMYQEVADDPPRQLQQPDALTQGPARVQAFLRDHPVERPGGAMTGRRTR